MPTSRYFMSGGSSPVGLGAPNSRNGQADASSARRRRQAANRALFSSTNDALSGGDPPWPSLGIGGVGPTAGEDASGASQVPLIAYDVVVGVIPRLIGH